MATSKSGISLNRALAIFAAALFLAFSSFPCAEEGSLVSDVLFWIGLVPQLMNVAPTENSYPDYQRDRREPVPLDKKQLSLLAADIDAGNKDIDWRAEMYKVWPSQPVVVRHLVQRESEHFPELLEVNTDFLRTALNDTEVSVFTHMTKDKSAISMPYSEYDAKMTNKSEKLYARAIPDTESLDVSSHIDHEWLANVMGVPWARSFTQMLAQGGTLKGRLPLTFVGSNHVWSQVHCDIGSSAFFMLQGRKRWVLFPPSQSRYLYPYGQRRNVAFNAGLNVFAPDTDAHPEFAKARGYEVILNPGDVLFFPSMWWHGVQNLDERTVGVDMAFLNPWGSWTRNSILTACSVLNPLAWKDVVGGLLSGRSVRETFFDGYHKKTSKASAA
eukprot:TRINITY_DN13407_c0_g1_i1.p1 TRINITY_DN13407_c0_g1~~TRINITY_DN13407_c0_g1_i1.p1  ORF type:complete len:398 (+),score=49.35 TRINITY_DN13407_c0_g1_i1:39-1196(+)